MFEVLLGSSATPLPAGKLLLVGRGNLCDIQLDDASASRVHCRLLARDGRVTLTDAGSRWGTFVNGVRISECELTSGDEIVIGETILTVHTQGEPHGTTLARRSELNRPASVIEPRESTRTHGDQPRNVIPLQASPSGEAYSVPASELVPSDHSGRRFFNYDVQELLVRSPSSLLFRAIGKSGQVVALKLFHSKHLADDISRQRFLRAAATMQGLRHPHLVQVLDGGEFEGIAFLATEFIEGDSASQLIQEIGIRGMLDWRRTLSIACDVASALEYLEDHGILHRDITPQHLIVRRSDHRALLGGVSLAKSLDDGQEALTTAGDIVGELPYLSPEQLGSGEIIDIRSDIYQLGATLYALLTGHPPFSGRTRAETITRVLTESPVPPTRVHLSIPPLLEGVILQLLQKHPADRPGSAALVVREFERVKAYCDC